jgi:hypothetical protein
MDEIESGFTPVAFNRTTCGFTDEQEDLVKTTLRYFVNSSCTYNETFARDAGDPTMTLSWV